MHGFSPVRGPGTPPGGRTVPSRPGSGASCLPQAYQQIPACVHPEGARGNGAKVLAAASLAPARRRTLSGREDSPMNNGQKVRACFMGLPGMVQADTPEEYLRKAWAAYGGPGIG